MLNFIGYITFFAFSTVAWIFIALLFLFLTALFSNRRMTQKDKHISQLNEDKNQLHNIIGIKQNELEYRQTQYNDLKSLQSFIEQASLYALLSDSGMIMHISDGLRHLLQIPRSAKDQSFVDMVAQNELQKQYLNELLNMPRSQIWEREVNLSNSEGDKLWLKMKVIPQNQQGRTPTILLICQNITPYIQAKIEIEEGSKQRLFEELQSQKSLALKVIQAQEAERDRIGKDMHDGIGQMLTALKFNIESVNIDKATKAKEKLSLIKEITRQIIKGVREVTFNLRPPELGDYGLDKGLSKLAEGITTFTGKQVVYENRTGFDERLDSNIESNLYRISQEAVNNAVKYADCNLILISLSHSSDMLSIKIVDDGKGFDIENVAEERESKISGGLGLQSMKERINYINGRIFVNSKIGEGSRITINVPLTKSLIEDAI